jgi:hypothetical protein
MAVIFALTDLFDGVVARFLLDGTNVPNLFGWREVPQKLVTGNRIIWVPGNPDGDVGELQAAKHFGPTLNPRPLYNLAELFHVYIVANDATAPENERAQYEAARLLYDAWLRAVHLKAFGRFFIKSQAWLAGRSARRFGNAIRVLATINAVVPDVEQAIAPVDTGAEVDLEQLDQTETIDVPAPT